MKLPRRITIGKKKYDVVVADYGPHKGCMGGVSYDSKLIHIGTRSWYSNRRFKTEEVADTFWHEVTHAILQDMNHKLEADEKFVTAFANRLTKVITKAEF